MSPEQILAMLVELQRAVRFATDDREHTKNRLGIGGATWADYTARIDEVDDAVNERERWLNAALAHDREWAHMRDDCPICQA